MNIRVTTKSPARFIRRANFLLRAHRQADLRLDTRQKFDGEVIYSGLSLAQFNALEDAAVQLGLEYDGRQMEARKPAPRFFGDVLASFDE